MLPKLKRRILFYSLISLFISCNKDRDLGRDCETPPAPSASYNIGVEEDGDLKLYADHIEEADYTWITPKGKSFTGQNLELKRVTQGDNGEYLVFATKNRCQSAVTKINVQIDKKYSHCYQNGWGIGFEDSAAFLHDIMIQLCKLEKNSTSSVTSMVANGKSAEGDFTLKIYFTGNQPLNTFWTNQFYNISSGNDIKPGDVYLTIDDHYAQNGKIYIYNYKNRDKEWEIVICNAGFKINNRTYKLSGKLFGL